MDRHRKKRIGYYSKSHMKSRVCVLTTVHDYNDNRVYYKEVLSLQKLGYDITYIAPNASLVNTPDINCIDLPQIDSVWKRLVNSFKVYKIAKNQKCDIYHFHDSELMMVGLWLKKFTNAKVVYDVHEDYPAQMLSKHYLSTWMRKPLYNIIRWLESRCNSKFDAIITADNFVYNHFSSDKTIVLYNYPQTEYISKSLEGVSIDKKWDVIFPGSMSKFTAKMIVDTVSIVKNNGCDIKAVMISPFHFDGGIDWVKSYIIVKGMNLDDFLIMKNIPPYEVPQYVASTKIGLIPLPDTQKMRANIPTKMFEYMYLGLPVITGDLPPSAQYLNRVKAGFLVDPNSPEEYAERILWLLKNPDKLVEIGLVGRHLVETECNWQAEENKLRDLYEKLCK